SVTPAIPGLRVSPSGNSLQLIGDTAAHTRYDVVVRGDLADAIGQKLGRDQTTPWVVGDAVPSVLGPSGVGVLDPAAKRPTFDVFSLGYDHLEVQLYAVAPADFAAYAAAMRKLYRNGVLPRFPGRKVVDHVVAVAGDKSRLAETDIDLAPALAATGLGHAIAIVTPCPSTDRSPDRRIAWVQSTRLGIDAHVDGDSLVAYATQLTTGASAPGVAVEIAPDGITGTTDSRGIATLALGVAQRKGTHYLLA